MTFESNSSIGPSYAAKVSQWTLYFMKSKIWHLNIESQQQRKNEPVQTQKSPPMHVMRGAKLTTAVQGRIPALPIYSFAR